jgi:hypothetical protein
MSAFAALIGTDPPGGPVALQGLLAAIRYRPGIVGGEWFAGFTRMRLWNARLVK